MSFAVKHRPQDLDDLVGQDAAVSQIRGMFANGNIANSLLITGLTGSGKTTLARIIARLANGADKLVDTVEINGAEARGIDDIRDLIKASKFAPRSNYRIFILDEIQQWTIQAKQAFLKVLEEPPPRTLFILCTNEPEKLPSTIIGRCQRVRLKPVSEDACITLLERVMKAEQLEIPVAVLKQVAHLTRFHPRDALHALEAVSNYIAGGGDCSNTESIASAVEQVVTVPPTEFLHRYLLSVYKGKYTVPLQIVQLVENPDYFLTCLMESHEQAMFGLVSPKLVSDYSRGWTSKLEEQDVSLTPEFMADILDEMVKSSTLLKQNTVDAKHLLVALTARIITMRKREAEKNV